MSDQHNDLAYEHNGQRISAERFYEIACDPRRSVAVEACAGAGKTWMLVSRIVRALLQTNDQGAPVCKPQDILAITFTKKAAGEMRERLHEWLEKFAHASPEVLLAELKLRGMSDTQAAASALALQGTYKSVLEGGRPVQIRTFHSWFAALLRIAPLAMLEELNLPASYELLEDDSRAVKLVWRRFFNRVVKDDSARTDYEALVAAHGRSQASNALESALSKRVEFVLADSRGRVMDAVQTFAQRYPSMSAYAAPTDALDGPVAREKWLAWSAALSAETQKSPKTAAALIVSAFDEPDVSVRLSALRSAMFVNTEDRLRSNLAKFAVAQEAEQELKTICAAQAQHDAWIHQQRMIRLTRVLIAEFAALKRERGWVDMNDIERAAQNMLSNSALSGWVQERLDARVKHLLIDEFQDTNPLQWHSLHAWLSGYGGAVADAPKIFLVGDPKQSIYRFRRAEPQVFVAAKAFIAQTLGGDSLSCDHTWRNSVDVIGVVNKVMNAAQEMGEFDGFRSHTTQAHSAGVVARLPQIGRDTAPDDVEVAEVADDTQEAGLQWRDSLTVPRVLPEEKLSALECRQAARWIQGRIAQGIAPGQIMVLARRRSKLTLMQDELRALHVRTQQPEKNDLSQAAEAQDVLALLDVLVSTGHDMSLARALRSPIFGASDDDLVWIARLKRAVIAADESAKPSWFELLVNHAVRPNILGDTPSSALTEAATKLVRWRALLDRLPPHDALDAIYEGGDLLARFASAAPDALRESILGNLRALLAASLRVDAARYATPYGFVRAVRGGLAPAPAIANSEAVRLLTVHGAKGLEAKIVLLLDTDSGPSRPDSMGALVVWPGAELAPTKFVFMVREKSPPACAADAFEEEKQARHREELNALYVAMTRAREELVISSSQPHRNPGTSWWRRLEAMCDPIEAAFHEAAIADETSLSSSEMGSYRMRILPSLTVRAASGQAVAKKKSDPDSPESLIGQGVHKLLEWSNAVSVPNEKQVAAIRKEFRLTWQQAALAVAIASRIIQGEGSWAWDASVIDWSGNEVALLHEGQSLRMDRLVRRRDTGHWWVFDYKSASRPDLQPALIEQLAQYRAAVNAAHPGDVVHAAFLGGDGRMRLL